MYKPAAAVMGRPFSLSLSLAVLLFFSFFFFTNQAFVFFTGNRALIPYNVSLDFGFPVKTNTDCQGFSPND